MRNYHKNNTFIDISNEIYWTSHFLKGYLGEKYDSQSISNHMFLDANVSLWSANQDNVIWQEGFNEFEVKDGISITKTTTEFSDVFGF